MHSENKTVEIPEKAKSWIALLARLGFVSRGAVYAIIGIIATWGAFAAGKQSTGSSGALKTILEQPFGQILLGITAIGLLGYALWQFTRAVSGGGEADRNGDVQEIALRAVRVVVGIIHLGLAYSAVSLIFFANRSAENGSSTKEWTAILLAQPFGQILVAAVGAGFISYGCFEIYKALTTKFTEDLKTFEMSEKVERLAVWVGRAGLTARGIVFGIIGVFLIEAVVSYDPTQAAGLSGALRSLEDESFGPFVLGIVALGLIAYGIHMFFMAIYREINID